MNKLFNPIFYALREIFVHKVYLFGFLILSILILWLFLFIPVWIIPGNDFSLQLSIMKLEEYLLFVTLSILTALSIVMNYYLWNHKKSAKVGLSLIGQSGIGILSGLIASIFGITTCAACLTFVFSLLGVGGIFFLLDYRLHIAAFSIVILMFSIFFTSQRVLGVCKTCKY